MKKNIYSYLMAALFLTACEEITPEDVRFDISVDKTTVKAGEPVVFNFDGNPNFITVFSGDEGHKYANRERTEIDASDVEKVSLSFSYLSKAAGTHKNPLTIYLSADFPGLSLKDAEADRNVIQNHEWKDITNDCLGKITDGASAVTDIDEIDLSDYRNGFVLAFRYQGKKELVPQRTVIITKLKVTSRLKNGMETKLEGKDMEFSVYDTYPSNAEKDPYKKVISGSAVIGTWNLIKWGDNEFRLVGSTKAATVTEDNDDWLISDPVKIGASCDPDKGEVIKDISRRVTSYEHIYEKPGTYTVTFLASNANIGGEKMVIKEMVIEVTE